MARFWSWSSRLFLPPSLSPLLPPRSSHSIRAPVRGSEKSDQNFSWLSNKWSKCIKNITSIKILKRSGTLKSSSESFSRYNFRKDNLKILSIDWSINIRINHYQDSNKSKDCLRVNSKKNNNHNDRDARIHNQICPQPRSESSDFIRHNQSMITN